MQLHRSLPLPFWLAALLLPLTLLLSAPAVAQERGFRASDLEASRQEARIALVIGNGRYKDSPLKNPPNDARLMEQTLRALGFEVIAEYDADRRKMENAIYTFGQELRKKKGQGVGLFYYAGHGVQVGGRNYLIPVNARIDTEHDVKVEAVDVNAVLAKMEGANNRMNVVVLDACRNNPFARSWRSDGGGGLTFMNAPAGTMIAYATAPGDVAMDGQGKNSEYTRALAKHMQTPDVPLETVFKFVREEVRAKSKSKQVPWESSSLTGDFFFKLSPSGGEMVFESSSADAEAPAEHEAAATPEAEGIVVVEGDAMPEGNSETASTGWRSALPTSIRFAAGLATGTGYGLATARPRFYPDLSIQPGLSPSILHTAFDIGLILNNHEFGAFYRYQVVELEPVFITARYRYWFDDTGLWRGAASLGAGYGRIRHTVDLAPVVDFIDTTAEGPYVVSLGYLGVFMFSDYVGLTLEPVLYGLFPDQSVHLDLQLGMRLEI